MGREWVIKVGHWWTEVNYQQISYMILECTQLCISCIPINIMYSSHKKMVMFLVQMEVQQPFRVQTWKRDRVDDESNRTYSQLFQS